MEGVAQPVDVVVEHAHRCTQPHGGTGGGAGGDVRADYCDLAGYDSGHAAKQDALAVDGIGEKRRGHGHCSATIDLAEDVGKGTVAGGVGDEVEGDGDDVAAQQATHGLGGLMVGVEEAHQYGAVPHVAGVGKGYGGEMDDDVAGKCLGAPDDAYPTPAV